jgi:hypothetical protein
MKPCIRLLCRGGVGGESGFLLGVSRNILVALFSFTVCTTGHAQLTNIAYEGFNYSAGSLAGQNGGTGWTSAWVNDYTSGATLKVSATGMSYSGMTTTGGSAVWGSGGNGISEDSRSLSLQDSGVVYVQLLSKFGSSSGGGTPNIRLLDSGVLTGGLGGNGGTHGTVMSILNTSLNSATDGSAAGNYTAENSGRSWPFWRTI